MTSATFDTLAARKALTDAGAEEALADAIVSVARDAVTEGVATRVDVGRIETELARLEARMTIRLYTAIAALAAFTAALKLI